MFYVADVTGHGVPAGLVAAINNALVLAYMEHYQTTYDIIVHLNRLLKLKTKPNVFMTMVLAMWDADAATLEFTQAGHDPILHYKAAEGSINELPPGGMALGMLPDISKIAKPDHVKIERDDVIVLYTDGIPEAWHNEKMTLGMESFKDIVRRCAPLRTAQEIHDGIIKEVREFMGDYPQMDDITIIVAKRTI
jgi:sigma-B regulation protein RsbU (phosphoserine phosphatase)